MQERHKIIVAARASGRVRFSVLSDPTLGSELRCIRAPDLRRPVDVPDRYNHVGSLGDELRPNLGISKRLTHS